jgi:hypothetical protein
MRRASQIAKTYRTPLRVAALGVCALGLGAAATTFAPPVHAAPTPVPVATVRPVQPTPVPPRPQLVATPVPTQRPAVAIATVTPVRQAPGVQVQPQPTFTPRIVYATVTPVPPRSVPAAPATNPGTNPQWRTADGPPPPPLGPATATPKLPTPMPTRTTRPLTPVTTKQVTQPPISGKAPLSFTPTGNAGGGGTAPVKQKISEALMYFGILSLSGAGSWGVYYLVRPPKD